jgi:mannose-6-phosphate isomerase-like protein (cupin superfamily)
MNQPFPLPRTVAPLDAFDETSRATFAASYPEIPHKLVHRLGMHPLMQLDALACLAEALPERAVEYNRAALPIGLNGEKAPANGIGIGETIRNIASTGSWAALKNIEQCPAYAELLASLLEELRPVIEDRTGAMLKPQGFVFVTSPDGVTPYHFDPEHNILLQIMGSKVMTMFPAGDARFAPDETHESYHTGGGRELFWRDELKPAGKDWSLHPGEALYVPVMSPHFVQNGPGPSVSLSITWRSEWSFAEADARAFNGLLRKLGMAPRAPGRWPTSNRAKALAWRFYAKLSGRR